MGCFFTKYPHKTLHERYAGAVILPRMQLEYSIIFHIPQVYTLTDGEVRWLAMIRSKRVNKGFYLFKIMISLVFPFVILERRVSL